MAKKSISQILFGWVVPVWESNWRNKLTLIFGALVMGGAIGSLIYVAVR